MTLTHQDSRPAGFNQSHLNYSPSQPRSLTLRQQRGQFHCNVIKSFLEGWGDHSPAEQRGRGRERGFASEEEGLVILLSSVPGLWKQLCTGPETRKGSSVHCQTSVRYEAKLITAAMILLIAVIKQIRRSDLYLGRGG